MSSHRLSVTFAVITLLILFFFRADGKTQNVGAISGRVH